MGMLSTFKQQMANRVILVDVVASLFGMGAWVAVNGIYTQLPLLVQVAPEGWNLPSYIVILIQIANIGPICYGIMQQFFPGKISDTIIIYVLMVIGSLALLFMAFFYEHKSVIGGTLHSTSLLGLVFGCALVACTSSVLFIPYMGRFRETYLISYMIGEGLSAFIPSITSLIQGAGGNPECRHANSSDPNSPLKPYYPPLKFTVTDFLIYIGALQILSLLAFFFLTTLPICKKERTGNTRHQSDTVNAAGSQTNLELFHEQKASGPGANQSEDPTTTQMDFKTYATFLILQVLVSTFANGLFPALQSYSCLPYGNVAYHLAINLGSMANPLACYIVFFVPYTTVNFICGLSGTAFIIAAYIFTTATMSPTPPLVGAVSGEILVVLSWILFTGLISYVKLSIATRFRNDGGKGLFWYGAMTQVGAAVGAIIGFVLINYTSIFTAYTPC